MPTGMSIILTSRILLILFTGSCILLALSAVFVQTDTQDPLTVRIYPQHVTVFLNKSQQFTVHFHGSLKENVTLSFDDGTNSTTNAEISPTSVIVEPSVNDTVDEIKVFNVYGLAAGLLDLIGHIRPKVLTDESHLFVQLTIAKSNLLIQIATIIGWMYFLAWTWSFWPQIWVNRIRASVVGLSFDYIALNLFGHTLYAAFNCAMYWSSSIQEDYMRRNPRGLIPVLANDVAFSLHATFATSIIVVQCFIYERGQQRVSWTGRTLMTIFSLVVTVMASLAFVGRTHWLDFFYTLSYIKLAITLIKYVPQAVLNYRRKSTVGWSIGNILLDFAGGSLSMVQMVINGYNYDDWASIFGDPTKFGLGLFSVLFDVLFIVQHYILYRNSNYIELTGDNIPTPIDPGSSHLPTSNEPIPEMVT